MAIDTKPNLVSSKFEQCPSDLLILSGCTRVHTTGVMDSCTGYRVSGVTIFDAGPSSTTSVQIGQNTCAIGINSISIGNASCAGAGCTISIGAGSYAAAIGDIAIGYNTRITGNTTINIGGASICNANTIVGYSAIANGLGVAVGTNANASSINTTALGYGSCAVGQHSIAIGGSGANACIGSAIAIGSVACACGSSAIAIGFISCGTAGYTVAIGYSPKANIQSSIAIGCIACALNTTTIAIGPGSKATGSTAIAIGSLTCSIGVNSIAIGNNTTFANNTCAIVLGISSCAIGVDSIVIGQNSCALCACDIVIGKSASSCSLNNGIAIGNFAGTCGGLNIAIGAQAHAYCFDTIAIGEGAEAFRDFSIAIGRLNKSCACNAVTIGQVNVVRSACGSIFGGYNNTICSGNTIATLIGTQNVTLTGSSYSNFVVVPSLAILTTPSGSGSFLCWNSISKKVELAPGSTSTASGQNITKLINKTSHGFNVNDVIGWSGSTYNKAIANGLYDGEILGVVTKCYNANCFDLTQAGYVTGLTSLSINNTYFLSPTTAGLLTATQPTGNTQISKAVLIADSSTSAWVLPYPGYIITTGTTGGGTSSLSEFSITGNGSATGFTVVHNKNKQFVMVEIVRNSSPYPTIYTNVQRTNANCLCVTFDTAPSNGLQYKILVVS